MSLIDIQPLSHRATPQSEPIPGSNQTLNGAGGFCWTVDDWQRLERFLILGCEGGTYYAPERDLLMSNRDALVRCLEADGPRAIRIATEISSTGRAAKNEPALFLLALALSRPDDATRAAAASALPQICRTGTHLLHFTAYLNALGGWGRRVRRAVGNWYLEKSPDDLAYQMIKYRQRDGWSQADVLRRAHPRTTSSGHQALFRWATAGLDKSWRRTVTRRTLNGIVQHEYPQHHSCPSLIQAFEEARVATDASQIGRLIRTHRLPREAIPTQWLNERSVWEALTENMPLTALIRNLGKLSSLGILTSGSKDTLRVIENLQDATALKKSRIHPFSVLLALKTYAQGQGLSGSLTWKPVAQITRALDDAFYKCFANVRPTGKRLLLALDVSGSMQCAKIHGSPITAAEASAAMALLTAATEPNHTIMAFSTQLMEVDIRASMRLEEAIKKVSNLPFAGTDCSLPMIWARNQRRSVDGFVVYTDSETWAGIIHPSQALRQYRREINPGARSVVVGMTATEFTIADPNDAGMLDIVGFDAASPSLMAEFLA